ncbi:MAG TPA: c-type cytochrome biogenesis protein CcmI [Aestuariivirga sp.]|jgi:cytochrome c-type biogenesis protein CcmH|nr:c-type cytochrome biogenesis protein CcmI [Aestuariivirga sp.]
MMIWLIFAGMTAAVVTALLVPFLRKSSGSLNSDAEFNRAIYRDQLQELERDQGRGLIGAAEAEAARNEISRRLLQVAKPKTLATGNRYSLLAVLLVPLIALPIYAKYGSPGFPDVPLQERLKGAIANQDFEALVATVEAHLAVAPNDVEGWKVLAPAYKREQRWSDAADAYANVLRLAPPTAEAISDYGEMLVFANEGMVTDEAENAFAEALKLEATNERAKFYYDMALKQEGKAPALSDEQIAAGQTMSTQDQTAMIAGMMDGLEQKLGNNSRDLEGWKRLIHARRISNEIDKAKISLNLAMNIFKDEPASLGALRELAEELGIAE